MLLTEIEGVTLAKHCFKRLRRNIFFLILLEYLHFFFNDRYHISNNKNLNHENICLKKFYHVIICIGNLYIAF